MTAISPSERQELFELTFDMAWLMSKHATCPRKSVGCVIAHEQKGIITVGWNGAPAGFPTCVDEGCIIEGGHCVRAIHAEMRALMSAAWRGISLRGFTAYVTLLPCINCFNALYMSGIREIVYDEEYNRDERNTLFLLAEKTDLRLRPRRTE